LFVAAGIVDTDGAPSVAYISANFRKKFEKTLMLFLGAWGKMFHGKNLKHQCPFKLEFGFFLIQLTFFCPNPIKIIKIKAFELRGRKLGRGKSVPDGPRGVALHLQVVHHLLAAGVPV
jgi:hypothetical protein